MVGNLESTGQHGRQPENHLLCGRQPPAGSARRPGPLRRHQRIKPEPTLRSDLWCAPPLRDRDGDQHPFSAPGDMSPAAQTGDRAGRAGGVPDLGARPHRNHLRLQVSLGKLRPGQGEEPGRAQAGWGVLRPPGGVLSGQPRDEPPPSLTGPQPGGRHHAAGGGPAGRAPSVQTLSVPSAPLGRDTPRHPARCPRKFRREQLTSSRPATARAPAWRNESQGKSRPRPRKAPAESPCPRRRGLLRPQRECRCLPPGSWTGTTCLTLVLRWPSCWPSPACPAARRETRCPRRRRGAAQPGRQHPPLPRGPRPHPCTLPFPASAGRRAAVGRPERDWGPFPGTLGCHGKGTRSSDFGSRGR